MDKLTSNESATITITRNTGNWGALSDITIYANDEKVANSFEVNLSILSDVLFKNLLILIGFTEELTG